jgi:uncharacterized protein
MTAVAVKKNVANWFEVPVTDLERATAFYERVFGMKLTTEVMGNLTMAMFPFDQNAVGAAGALVKAETYEPSRTGTVVYFSVDDIDETLRRITANGGKVLMQKTPIGQYGAVAQYEDPEGNRLALHAMK